MVNLLWRYSKDTTAEKNDSKGWLDPAAGLGASPRSTRWNLDLWESSNIYLRTMREKEKKKGEEKRVTGRRAQIFGAGPFGKDDVSDQNNILWQEHASQQAEEPSLPSIIYHPPLRQALFIVTLLHLFFLIIINNQQP